VADASVLPRGSRREDLVVRISALGLNRCTLGRQLLLRREALGVVDAVHRVGALQAQHAASPYLALWNRVTAFDPADVDAAFAEHEVIKATLMRMTLHAIRVEDYPSFRQAVEPSLRATRLGRFSATGPTTLAEADALVADLLEFANQPRTPAEVVTWLGGRFNAAPKPAWQQLRGYAPLWHVPAGGPWTFGPRPSYVAAGRRPVLADPSVADASLQTLVWRYLEAFGPASVADVAQFAMVQGYRVKGALRALSGSLEQLEGPDGAALVDVPDASRPAEDTFAPPRLLPMWDSILLAYRDRGRVIPPEYRRLVTRTNGDVLPTLLVDGYVAGVWRPVETGIEASAFHRLPDEAWEGLAVEARSLVALLADREPQVYRRYQHWWANLRSLQVRVLPG